MLKRFYILCILLLLPTVSMAAPALDWNAVTQCDDLSTCSADGYIVYYGSVSSNYTHTVDVGNSTSYSLSSLSTGTYYFAVTAYSSTIASSVYSNESSTLITAQVNVLPNGQIIILYSGKPTVQAGGSSSPLGKTMTLSSGLAHVVSGDYSRPSGQIDTLSSGTASVSGGATINPLGQQMQLSSGSASVSVGSTIMAVGQIMQLTSGTATVSVTARNQTWYWN